MKNQVSPSYLFVPTVQSSFIATASSCHIHATTHSRSSFFSLHRQRKYVFAFPLDRSRSPSSTHIVYMSGVNGGLEYELDLDQLSLPVREAVELIWSRPATPEELIRTAQTLADIKDPQTIPVLVDLLGFNNPSAALIAVNTLSDLEAFTPNQLIPYLLKGVAAFNYGVNAYALRALGKLGDPSVRAVCDECAYQSPIPNVRRAAIKALGSLKYTEATEIDSSIATLVILSRDPDWSVRYACVVALEILASQTFTVLSLTDTQLNTIREAITEAVELDLDPTVNNRAKLALEALQPVMSVL